MDVFFSFIPWVQTDGATTKKSAPNPLKYTVSIFYNTSNSAEEVRFPKKPREFSESNLGKQKNVSILLHTSMQTA